MSATCESMIFFRTASRPGQLKPVRDSLYLGRLAVSRPFAAFFGLTLVEVVSLH